MTNCTVYNCFARYKCLGFCSNHYKQFKKYGRILSKDDIHNHRSVAASNKKNCLGKRWKMTDTSNMKRIPWNRGLKGTGISWTEARRRAQPPKKPRTKPVVMNGKEYHPNWHEIRNEIYKRDKWKCQECGVKTSIKLGKIRIACHHIDYNIDNVEKSNLITLCASCHAKTNFNREDWLEHFQSIER